MKMNRMDSLTAIALSAFVVFAAACNSDQIAPEPKHHQPGAAATEASVQEGMVTVTIPQDALNLGPASFGNTAIRIAVGTQVTWVNEDTKPHTVTCDEIPFYSGILETKDSFTYTFYRAGSYPFYSSLEGEEKLAGVIEVVETASANSGDNSGALTRTTPAPSSGNGKPEPKPTDSPAPAPVPVPIASPRPISTDY